ncbi:uncharacterized protein LOC130979362 [Arachis stenosperma]|uniref:uncharacterized protein LOC130979362 n=1 Tax=Arachis stenosperma TaxID=217475 RepID=UPI0025AC7CE1|nr:uncharacterized protein LOC130979362 [Arachis stenosperma]XP_057758771.1 uncharacterized protein LOC130979362 [Arachis stenosperma]XP_057758772.1 uncharacterized protein LOC130979362 [Arachis stenosperma]XP_057758773.1 uncharacterized protein LOC130979362 [Arachis stenosperma]
MKLHESRQTHGNITDFNLVTRNGEGYLGGSIRSTLSKTVIRGERGSVVVRSPYTEDILNLAGVLASCLDHNFLLELKLFTDYLNYHQTLDSISHHPYLSSPIGIREFYVAVQQDFGSLDNSNLSVEFQLAKARTGYHPKRRWRREVRRLKDQILIDVLDFKGSKYTDSDAARVKFCRNVWVHGAKDPQSSTKEHCDLINKVLEGLWPGFSCLVYEVACQGKLRRIF